MKQQACKTILAALILVVIFGGSVGYGQPLANDPPIGTIVAYAGPISSGWEQATGWMECDGRELQPSAYPELFQSIRYSWGKGAGDDTFCIPKLRDLFLRGVKGGNVKDDPEMATRVPIASGGNAGNNVGSYQSDTLESHLHAVSDPGHSHGLNLQTEKVTANGAGTTYTPPDKLPFPRTKPSPTGLTVQPAGGTETRPKNAFVYWIIRVKEVNAP